MRLWMCSRRSRGGRCAEGGKTFDCGGDGVSIKISLGNLGILKKADFSLGDLTIICGKNNTGKTYATYALFGFLWSWKSFLEIEIRNQTTEALFKDGVTRIDVTRHVRGAGTILKQGCEAYTEQLPRIFASKADRFKEATFQVRIDQEPVSAVVDRPLAHRVRFGEDALLSLSKAEGERELVISLLLREGKSGPPVHIITEMISDHIIELLFDEFFPRPFIASAERTGAAIFRKELNFARNRLLEEMSRADRDIDPMELLFKSYQDYPLPVKVNVDFIRRLEDVAKEDSFLVKNHPRILKDFADIIGGEYIAGSNDTIYFKPVRQRLKLTMDESSSAVRSLLDIGFYLRHVAAPGQLLLVDEPELNLHPENQRRIARLLARLVNVGVKVFVTTHSDYIIKELNTLIMLNHDKPHLKRIANEHGYRDDELIKSDQVRVYMAQEDLMPLEEGRQRRSRGHTFMPADIDPVYGIEASSFDNTIDEMNWIQEEIVWGAE